MSISYAVFCLKKKKSSPLHPRPLNAPCRSRAAGRGLGRCRPSTVQGRSFFCKDTATTEIYTLSLHDALPISWPALRRLRDRRHRHRAARRRRRSRHCRARRPERSEEHTSELQSHVNLVCRLLLEKKNKTQYRTYTLTTKKRKTTN